MDAKRYAEAKKRAAWLLKMECEEGWTFEEIMDAFALMAKEEGHRVIVDGVEWLPPAVNGEVQ